MSFLDYLDTLRAKPDGAKTRIALSISFVVTAIICSVWIVSNYVLPQTNPTIAGTELQAESPLSSLTATVSTAFKDLTHELGTLKDRFSSLFNETYTSRETLGETGSDYFQNY